MSPHAAAAVLLLAFAPLPACSARGARTAPPDVLAAARAAATYRARLHVSLRGPTVRARTPVLVGFRRPDALRLEIPGPGGPRLIVVAAAGTLTAVAPPERAFYRGPADEAGLDEVLGIALTPGEVMDVLVGVRPPRLAAYDVRWGVALPAHVTAALPDGTRLAARVEQPETAVELPPAAFAVPPLDGYRELPAGEARALWR